MQKGSDSKKHHSDTNVKDLVTLHSDGLLPSRQVGHPKPLMITTHSHSPVERDIHVPPEFCQLASGHCDQRFGMVPLARGTVLYPSSPPEIAGTIEGAAALLKKRDVAHRWRTWRDLSIAGQVIFCEICKATRFSDLVVADVTTLNYNLMFEIGFALGLEQPIALIRDSSYELHRREFEDLGIIDTIGYIDFRNSEELANRILTALPIAPLPTPAVELDSSQPLYVLKGHLATDGEIRLMSLLKKSRLRFRQYDVTETPRLSLHELRRNVAASQGVVTHLMSPNRQGALVHNARCALAAGIAAASNKIVLVLQEGAATQPIDYRDVVQPYFRADQLERLVNPFINQVYDRIQDVQTLAGKAPERFLERLSLGDVAAENEIVALREYFVRTAQFNSAKRGTARLLIGRKGSGKTAIFYALRDSLPRTHSHLVLDLKPEGFQFTRLREVVLNEMTGGMQGHTLTAFWEYILLCELAQRITDTEFTWAQRDQDRRRRFAEISAIYSEQPSADAGDFSERLLLQVDLLTQRVGGRSITEIISSGQVTEVMFKGEIRALSDAIAPYLEEKEEVWLLFDNLDKGWPTRGASPTDILVLRTLLEATRKIQRQLERRDVAFHTLVCLRNDIYDLLVRETPDRGKDTAISLDWDDADLFKLIVLERIRASTELDGDFDQVWPQVFDVQVGHDDSFSYILDRTLMRPRDLLNFLHRATEVSLNRGHNRVSESDLVKAEVQYSEDMLRATDFEFRDIYPEFPDLLYVFLGCAIRMDESEVRRRIGEAGVPSERHDHVLEALVWFGFLGMADPGRSGPIFSYHVRYNVERLLSPVRRGQALFAVHPAFHRALDCTDPAQIAQS